MAVEDDMDAVAHPPELRLILDLGMPSIDHLRDAHVEAMMRAFDEPDLAPRRSVKSRIRRRSRVGMVVTAALLACMTASSALAATGTLPGPVQRAVSRSAERLGITIPRNATGPTSEQGSAHRSDRATERLDSKIDEPKASKAKPLALPPQAPVKARPKSSTHQGASTSAQHSQSGNVPVKGAGRPASHPRPTKPPAGSKPPAKPTSPPGQQVSPPATPSSGQGGGAGGSEDRPSGGRPEGH